MKLVIAEKLSVMESISNVLGVNIIKDGYMEGNNYIVTSLVNAKVILENNDITEVSIAIEDGYTQIIENISEKEQINIEKIKILLSRLKELYASNHINEKNRYFDDLEEIIQIHR